MKKHHFQIIALLLLLSGVSFAQPRPAQADTKKVKVYYFHNTRRCETCLAVENETKNALQTLFPEEMKKGSVEFVALNFDDNKNARLAQSLEISGQALVVIKEGKKTDLTNKAFLLARTNPEKFRQVIKEAVGQ